MRTSADTAARATAADDVVGLLDLDRPELADARAAPASGRPAALLAHVRARTSVRHPVDDARRGACASARDLRVADDALRHVFITQRDYPPHAFGDEIDWFHWPNRDREWIVQLHRLSWWQAMGRAYRHTGDERYAREWCAQFLDWRRRVPIGHEHAWRLLEVGIRAQSLTTWFAFFRHSPCFTEEVLLEFLGCVHDHAIRLLPWYRSGHNHGLMHAEGLAHLGVVFPEFRESAAWARIGIARLEREIDLQILPDGVHVETSWHYHGGSLEWFRRTADLAEANGIAFSDGYRRKLERMYEALALAAKPDGTTAMFGDSWHDGVAPWLEPGAERSGRADLAFVCARARGASGGREPAARNVALPHGGYWVFRSDWTADAIWLMVKCAPDGGWHAHGDNNSFELFAHGKYLMPDTGMPIYSGDEARRRWSQATRRHQCLTLDGGDARLAPRVRFWQDGGDCAALCVENGSYPGLTHRRTIVFVQRRFFVIVDEALGDAPGLAELHFQFGPPSARIEGRDLVMSDAGVRLRLSPLTAHAPHEEEGRVAFNYLDAIPRAGFAYPLRGRERFTALLVPWRGERPDVRGGLREMADGDDGFAVDLAIDGRRHVLRRVGIERVTMTPA